MRQFCSTTRSFSNIIPISFDNRALLPLWSSTARLLRRDRPAKQLPDGGRKFADRPTRPHPTNPESGGIVGSSTFRSFHAPGGLDAGGANVKAAPAQKGLPTRPNSRAAP